MKFNKYECHTLHLGRVMLDTNINWEKSGCRAALQKGYVGVGEQQALDRSAVSEPCQPRGQNTWGAPNTA